MKSLRIGFALTGSFCTFARVRAVIEHLMAQGHEVTPIFSAHASTMDTRFGTAEYWKTELESLTRHKAIDSIVTTEPIGPKAMFDVLVVAPCTGNTIAKLALGITDTPVTMAVKSHLRGAKPVILGISTNDALSGSAANIGTLLNRKHYYFVPFRQDAPDAKPCSIVAEMELIESTIESALEGKQLQPLLRAPNEG